MPFVGSVQLHTRSLTVAGDVAHDHSWIGPEYSDGPLFCSVDLPIIVKKGHTVCLFMCISICEISRITVPRSIFKIPSTPQSFCDMRPKWINELTSELAPEICLCSPFPDLQRLIQVKMAGMSKEGLTYFSSSFL